MVNKPKNIGTATESAVVRYLRTHGYPGAERRALRGRDDAGDITGCPGLAIEVKGGKQAINASDSLVASWLIETESERVAAGADIGLLVIKRSGIGTTNVDRWWAVMTANTVAVLLAAGEYPPDRVGLAPVRMHLGSALVLLRAAGYGEPLPDEAVA